MEHFKGKLLKEYTSFLVGGKAKDLYIPRSFEDVERLLKELYTERKDFYVLGKGSNVLISDEGLDAPVILLRENLSGMQFCSYKEYLGEKRKEENQKAARIKDDFPLKNKEDIKDIKDIEDVEELAIFTALAGTSLSELAKFAEEKGYTGMEALSGIPGTVGGAVKMNAGAYNSEIKDVFHHGVFCKRSGELLELPLSKMDFSYRHSAVEDGMLCLSASFLLKKGEPASIREKMEDFRARRAEKQPLELPSAGSTFKRPEGDYASRLIEVAGLRGFRMENAAVSEKHCGFVVNLGEATARNIYELIEEVKRVVKEKEGVQLETEIKLWGKF